MIERVVKLIKFIFKDTIKNKELILPVTPSSFEVNHGINVETINIHTLGDVSVAGYKLAPTYKVDCMFPAKKYPFCQPKADLNPYSYVKKFEEWCDNHTVLRYIISDTMVNTPVLISDITYGEKDGTGDVYATITMRNYKTLSVVQTNKTGNRSRSSTEKKTSPSKSYTIKRGDTLSAICRKHYGNAALYPKLAAVNGIKNPNLISSGKTLKLPAVL
ncbi:LysM peptidoglycan-binding domain-containing protein [Ruminiclostridium josui]|uniref:LysM peptidoglycan-binding domain-containing protein n=1 Tax=Ruminiclostridium josui TaxID=1499 RepID=UPI0004BADD9C|nr:LysM peptidoglycan-binding domain-containing protein [Ruminiclostridium josui]